MLSALLLQNVQANRQMAYTGDLDAYGNGNGNGPQGTFDDSANDSRALYYSDNFDLIRNNDLAQDDMNSPSLFLFINASSAS